MGAGVWIVHVAVVKQTEILGIKVKALYCCIVVIELAFILSWLAFLGRGGVVNKRWRERFCILASHQ